MMTNDAARGPLLAAKARAGSAAFTLLELLVVAAMVFVLGSLLLVGLAHSSDQSARAACRNNLRQLYVAAGIYAADNGDRVLSARTSGGEWVQIALGLVPNSVLPGIGLTNKDSVWTCPNRPGFPAYDPSFVQWTIGYQYFGGITAWRNPMGSYPSVSPVRLSQSAPHWTLAADVTMKVNGSWGGQEPLQSTYSNVPPHHASDSLVPQGGNQVFMDGSAEWVPFERMYFLTSWDRMSRAAYFYQDPKDFPGPLKSTLSVLRAKP